MTNLVCIMHRTRDLGSGALAFQARSIAAVHSVLLPGRTRRLCWQARQVQGLLPHLLCPQRPVHLTTLLWKSEGRQHHRRWRFTSCEPISYVTVYQLTTYVTVYVWANYVAIYMGSMHDLTWEHMLLHACRVLIKVRGHRSISTHSY